MMLIFQNKILAGSSYIKLPKELNHPRKGLINIDNMNHNECFKWCIVRYSHPADHHPGRILSALVSLIMKIRKNIQSIYQKKCYEDKYVEKYVDLLLIVTMFLLRILILLFMVMLYIVEKNIFAVIVYKPLVKKKY